MFQCFKEEPQDGLNLDGDAEQIETALLKVGSRESPCVQERRKQSENHGMNEWFLGEPLVI